MRGATRTRIVSSDHSTLFQSTHPLRGATGQLAPAGAGDEISIHAPLAGCDDKRETVYYVLPISIHAPLAGCDFLRCRSSEARPISIHAPLAGCDRPVPSATACRNNFNPRTPCGVRLASNALTLASVDFNPRTPCGVRPCRPTSPSRPLHFNPRTPCGVRPARSSGSGCWRNFNPRTPCGVRRRRFPRIRKRCRFQSTHPLRGATSSPDRSSRHGSISIHAPLAGCDRFAERDRAGLCHFNPRTPCGVRR